MRSYAAILATLLVAAFFSACSSGTTGEWGFPGKHGDPSVTAAEQAMIDRHNATRSGQGLGTLTVNAQLCQIAQDQANYMVDIGQITHDDAQGGRVGDRAQAVGYVHVLLGENVGYDWTADGVYDMWLGSSGHYANITRPGFTEIGIGMATRGLYEYWCVVFGDR